MSSLFAREKEMKPIVVNWLESRGYFVTYEIMIGCGWCDLIGCKWSERVGRKLPDILEACAIELKVADIAGVLYQATGNLDCGASASYAAIPADRIAHLNKRSKARFADEGIGLLSVTPHDVQIEIPANRDRERAIEIGLAKRLWSAKLRYARERGKEKPK